MEIRTKFNLGDKVYTISSFRKPSTEVCESCDGSGKITYKNGEKYTTCPDCRGNGYIIVHGPEKWQLSEHGPSKIGKIEVQIYSEKHKSKNNESLIRYMIESTGIGSGTLWRESELFFTEQEALEECEIRNSITIE